MCSRFDASSSSGSPDVRMIVSRCISPPEWFHVAACSDEERVAKLLDGRLDSLDLLLARLLLRKRRQGPHRGRLARRPHQLLEAAGDQDEQHPAAPIADREAMGDVARAEDVVAGTRLDRRLSHLEGDFALEDPEALVVAV